MYRTKFHQGALGACLVLLAASCGAEPAAMVEPALADWVRAVVRESPDIQAAEAAVAAARARAHAAERPLFNPELEFDYENSTDVTTSGGISQTIDWSDKRGARATQAGFELARADAELQSKREALAAALLQALADWHTADAVAAVSERQTGLMQRFAGLAERRRKAGDLGQVELDLAHLAAADAAIGEANAAADLIRARQALAELTGVDSDTWPAFPGVLPDVEPQHLDAARLLQALPAVRAAAAQVAGARAALQLSSRESRPDPTIGLRAGREDSDTLTGVSLSVPLFVRNSYRAEVEAANADLLQAEREAANTRRLAHARLIAAAQLYRNARGSWQTWEVSGATRFGQRTDLLDRMWEAGELDTTDYLVQLSQALETEVKAMQTRGRMWQAWADWLVASGQAEAWLNLTGEVE